jgi:hypothetical protein
MVYGSSLTGSPVLVRSDSELFGVAVFRLPIRRQSNFLACV